MRYCTQNNFKFKRMQEFGLEFTRLLKLVSNERSYLVILFKSDLCKELSKKVACFPVQFYSLSKFLFRNIFIIIFIYMYCILFKIGVLHIISVIVFIAIMIAMLVSQSLHGSNK